MAFIVTYSCLVESIIVYDHVMLWYHHWLLFILVKYPKLLLLQLFILRTYDVSVFLMLLVLNFIYLWGLIYILSSRHGHSLQNQNITTVGFAKLLQTPVGQECLLWRLDRYLLEYHRLLHASFVTGSLFTRVAHRCFVWLTGPSPWKYNFHFTRKFWKYPYQQYMCRRMIHDIQFSKLPPNQTLLS